MHVIELKIEISQYVEIMMGKIAREIYRKSPRGVRNDYLATNGAPPYRRRGI